MSSWNTPLSGELRMMKFVQITPLRYNVKLIRVLWWDEITHTLIKNFFSITMRIMQPCKGDVLDGYQWTKLLIEPRNIPRQSPHHHHLLLLLQSELSSQHLWPKNNWIPRVPFQTSIANSVNFQKKYTSLRIMALPPKFAGQAISTSKALHTIEICTWPFLSSISSFTDMCYRPRLCLPCKLSHKTPLLRSIPVLNWPSPPRAPSSTQPRCSKPWTPRLSPHLNPAIPKSASFSANTSSHGIHPARFVMKPAWPYSGLRRRNSGPSARRCLRRRRNFLMLASWTRPETKLMSDWQSWLGRRALMKGRSSSYWRFLISPERMVPWMSETGSLMMWSLWSR